MPAAPPITRVIELTAQALIARNKNHPHAEQLTESSYQELCTFTRKHGPLMLSTDGVHIIHKGGPVMGTPNASRYLAREMSLRSMEGVAFLEDLDSDEFQTFLFALELRPERLAEMGGVSTLLSDDACVRIRTRTSPPAQSEDAQSVPAPATKSNHAPLIGLPPAPSHSSTVMDLRCLLETSVRMTRMPPQATPGSRWSPEERNALIHAGFMVADFSSFPEVGHSLGLTRMDAHSAREALRKALEGLNILDQIAVVLGFSSLPSREHTLLRAMDVLAPEFIAHGLSDANRRLSPVRTQLALLAASLLRVSRNRDLALETIRGQFLYECFDPQELQSLLDAIRWELQGTDTKLRKGVENWYLLELEHDQVMDLVRQLIRKGRWTDLNPILDQIREALMEDEASKRCRAMCSLVGVIDQTDDETLGDELESRLWTLARLQLDLEDDPPTLQWTCQAIESNLSRWLHQGRFDRVYTELYALGECIRHMSGDESFKAQALLDALARLACPTNLALLAPMLHQKEAELSAPQLFAILALLGQPAAEYLVVCLELEEERRHRMHLLAAIQAIGKPAIPALTGALASSQWYLVRNAVQLLGEMGDRSVLHEITLTLEHRDLRVRKAAEAALIRMEKS